VLPGSNVKLKFWLPNHTNIASIYDLQETNGSSFLVLELVEGETLAERIQRVALPIDEALQIAVGICDAPITLLMNWKPQTKQ